MRDAKSRAEVKREFRELKQLGLRLAALSPGQLRDLPLSEKTREALLAAKQMSRAALQRQYRYLSSLLANEDVAVLRAALTKALQPHVDEVAALHAAEQWRAALLSADEGQLAALIERFPECDRTELLRLVRDAHEEQGRGLPPRASRQLFRYLRLRPAVGKVAAGPGQGGS
jgi:ribosome-associated protein